MTQAREATGTVEGLAVDEENETEALVTIRCTVEQSRAWAMMLGDRVRAVSHTEESTAPEPEQLQLPAVLPLISSWPETELHGSKRTNLVKSEFLTSDWFVGHGKDESCQFEGSWWDMICFARNVLASENTKLAAPEFHRPEWANDHYVGDEPYQFRDSK